MNGWTLALPTIIFSSYIVAYVYYLGEKFKPAMGICAAVFLFATMEYVNMSRMFSLDIAAAAAALTIFGILIREKRWRYDTLIIILCLIFAFFVRGFIGLILSGALLAGVLLSCGQYKEMVKWAFIGTGVVLFCLIFGYLLVYAQGGNELLRLVYDWQVGKRFDDDPNYFYYLTNAVGSYAPVYPVALVVLALNFKKLLNMRDSSTDAQLMRRLFWAYFLPVLVISVPGCQHLRYMTISLPALALLAGYGMASSAHGWNGLIRQVFDFVSLVLVRVLPVVLVLAALFMMIWLRGLVVGGILIAAVTAFAIAYRKIKVDTSKIWLKRFASTGILLALLTSGFISPLDSYLESSSEFANQVEALHRGKVYLLNLKTDHDDIKYIFNVPIENRDAIFLLRDKELSEHLTKLYPALGNSSILENLEQEDLVISTRKYFEETIAPFGTESDFESIIFGKMGHMEFVAFRHKR